MILLRVLFVFTISVAFPMRLCYGQQFNINAYATVQQLVTAAGYPIEKHWAYTPDGYILQLFRIPSGQGTKRPTRGKKAVVLVHGLFGGADNFIVMGPNSSIADKGYDVCLATVRGEFSTSHKTLSRTDPAFWEYSIHEHGKYDAPAFIDKILRVTGLSKIMYVGHSMGCTIFYIMTSLRPEYNDKLIAFVGLGPAGYLDYLKHIVHKFVEVLDLPGIIRKRHINAIASQKSMREFVGNSVCSKQGHADILCKRISFLVFGEGTEQQNPEWLYSLLTRIQPASLGQLEHFAKIALTGVFTSLADGLSGAIHPYNLTNIRTPVSLWYGSTDQLTVKNDIIRMAEELNRTGTLYTVREATPGRKFNHIDFIIAQDIAKLFNLPLYEHLEELYNKFGKDCLVFYLELITKVTVMTKLNVILSLHTKNIDLFFFPYFRAHLPMFLF